MPQESISGNIRGFDGAGLEGVVVQLISQDSGETIETIHSIANGYWEFIRPATGKYNVLFSGRNTTDDDDIYGIEIVDMSEFESSEQFLNDTPPSGAFGDGSTPIAHVTNRLEAAAIIQWTYTPDATNKHQGFVVRYEHGPSSGQTITSTSPSLKIDSDARDFAIQIPADDYITIRVYAYFNGVSGANEDVGYQHANWIDSQATALATLSGWDSNVASLSKNNAILHSDGYLVLGTGNDVIRLDATHATYREWIGHATDPTLAPYAVEKDGTLHATGAIIDGEITATSGKITGSLYVGDPTPNRILIDGSAKTIGSESFVSGASGWIINGDGDAEFNSIVARGNIATQTLLFQETTVTRGSSLITKSGGELFEGMTATGTTFTIKITTPPSGGAPLSSGDICIIDNGINQTWFSVGAPTDNTTHFSYTVTYQSGSTTASYGIGTAVADYGISGDGGIIITADRSNAPYFDVFTHAGSPWTTTTTQLRAGKLDGITDADFGGALSGYGLYSDNIYLKGNITLASGTFKTNVSGQRIEIDGGANTLTFYDGSGSPVLIIDDDSTYGTVRVIGAATRGRGISVELIDTQSGDVATGIDVDILRDTGDGGHSSYGIKSDVENDSSPTDGANVFGMYSVAVHNGTGAVFGVLGNSSSNAGVAYGVYGTATTTSGTAWAGYFAAGDVYIADNLGIGTESPLYTLHINNDSGNGNLMVEGTTTAAYLWSESAESQTAGGLWRAMLTGGDLQFNFNTAGGLDFTTRTEVLSLNANGNVGINESNPDASLEIAGTTPVIHLDSSANAFIDMDRGSSGAAARIRYQTAGVDDFEAGVKGGVPGYHITDGSVNELVTVLVDGKVGFSTITPRGTADINGDFLYADEAKVTISGDAITVTQNFHSIETEGAVSADLLDTINGGKGGMILALKAFDSGNTVTVKDGIGNLRMAGDFALTHQDDTLLFMYSSALSAWLELSRSGNTV